ncbi:MAG: pilus assembly protein TadG-related protein [Deltaproteobacteria bacterium]|nr:pilus assembly protein TadG-related protein [Deltaproteobacteria bacterium]
MHNNRRAKEQLTPPLGESGAVAVYFLLIFGVLCGIGGLAVDYGNMVRVRAEVQRTADAAALAGAAGLLPYTNPGSNSTPNWANAVTKAQTMLSNVANKADNQQFAADDGTVAYGYWLLAPPTGFVQTLPTARPTTAAYLPEPAIKVTLSRNVSLYLAPLVGVSTPKTVSAIGIAILPEAYTTSKLIPIAVSYDTVYNTSGGNVVIDVTETGIMVNSNKNEAGWFTMTSGENFPQSVINNPLTAGTDLSATNIYLQPGSEVTLMHQLLTAGQTFVVTVVQNVEQKTTVPIIGFAAFQVDSLTGPTMTGHFVNQYFDPNVVPSAGTGIISSVAGTPKLVSP